MKPALHTVPYNAAHSKDVYAPCCVSMELARCRYLNEPQKQDSRISIDTTKMAFGMTCAVLLGLTALMKVCCQDPVLP